MKHSDQGLTNTKLKFEVEKLPFTKSDMYPINVVKGAKLRVYLNQVIRMGERVIERGQFDCEVFAGQRVTFEKASKAGFTFVAFPEVAAKSWIDALFFGQTSGVSAEFILHGKPLRPVNTVIEPIPNWDPLCNREETGLNCFNTTNFNEDTTPYMFRAGRNML